MYIQYILYYIEHTFENHYFFVINNYFCSITTSCVRHRDVPSVTRSVPDYYFSLGRIILSRIATIAAGTIPEPPKTSCRS